MDKCSDSEEYGTSSYFEFYARQVIDEMGALGKESCKEGLVEPLTDDQEPCGKEPQEIVDKEIVEPAYGPWMLVSYGRQGNRVYKSRNGYEGGQAAPMKHAGNGYSGYYKGNTGGSAGPTYGNSGNYVGHSNGNAGGNIGSFNGHSNGKQVANGKNVGSGGSYGKKVGTAAEGRGMGKSFTASSTAKAKNASMSAALIASTSSGSRFEILREEEGVILSTTGNQGNTQAEAEVQIRESVVLLDVTNQNIAQNIAGPKISSQRSKKISKKGKKPVALVGPLEVNHKGVEFYKKSFGLDKASNSNPTPCQLDSEVLDNAAALRQLHREVNKFDGTCSDIRGDESLLSDRCELEPPVETFDKVASDLKEAMEVIVE
ncbi:hypothetical protein Q3G72_027752 [Acer saccharum]|nr:hypothetical protein Q3G72_027752 [Acer saccharum]